MGRTTRKRFATREFLRLLRFEREGCRRGTDRADNRGVHKLPVGDRARRRLLGRACYGTPLLLDLLGGRQGVAEVRTSESAVPALDRYLRRRGVRRHRDRGSGA